MKDRLFKPLTILTLSVFVLMVRPGIVEAGSEFQNELAYLLPGSANALGINGKDSELYAQLGKLAAKAINLNRTPYVDSVDAGRSVTAESIRDDFSTYCLDSDYSDKVAWRRGQSGEIWLQFSCLKDGEYPAIRERLFSLTIAHGDLIDFRLLSANIEPGATLEVKATSVGGMKSPIARATVAITGAILLSAAGAKRSYPGQDDKVHHSVASGVLAAGTAAYFHFVHEMSPEKAALAGGALSVLIGGSKEALDPHFTGVRSKHDMKANLIGAAIGTVTVYLTFKFY